MQKRNLLDNFRKRGFSESVIEAFAKVKREDFVQAGQEDYSYEDIPLSIGYDQTISQPSTVAFMLNLLDLKEGNKVLEIGSGSGYALALISEIVKNGKVYGVERIKELAVRSQKLLKDNKNIKVINRSGAGGLPEFAPFDRILISAACPEIPRNLYSQLKDPGIMVAAVRQSIFLIKKNSGEIIEKEFPGFAFVPFIQ